MFKKNNLEKTELIKNGNYCLYKVSIDVYGKNVCNWSETEYKRYFNGIEINSQGASAMLDTFFENGSIQNLVEIRNCEKAKYRRVRKAVEKILDYGESPCFLTLTFNDDCLKNTTSQTRHEYVKKILKKQCGNAPYVANIDFGTTNEREHYHAIVPFEIDLSWWEKNCGFFHTQAITIKNPLRLSKYVSKFANHAIKASTKNNRIIYSRNVE